MSDIEIKKDKELDCSIAEFTNANFKLVSGSVNSLRKSLIGGL